MIEVVPRTYVATLDLVAIFGRNAPLHVDLGCGDGSFLADLARSLPDKNFLGIERLADRVAKACRKAERLHNVRVLLAETSYAVRYLLPPASVERFYLLFPDPWPKRRHHRRRIVTPDFLDSIHAALDQNGLLHIATDHLDYFLCIERAARAAAQEHSPELDCLKEVSPPRFELVHSDELDLPPTKFERKFREAGLPIYGLVLRKISPVI